MRAPSSLVLLSALAAAVWPVACGSSPSGGSGFTPDASTTGSEGGTGDGGSLLDDSSAGDGSLVNNKTVTGLTISPDQASIQSLDGMPATQQFQAIAQFSDNTTGPIAGATWSANDPQVGSVASGLFTASGSQGGTVSISASYGGKSATATLVVKLHLEENPGNVSGSVQGAIPGSRAQIWSKICGFTIALSPLRR